MILNRHIRRIINRKPIVGERYVFDGKRGGYPFFPLKPHSVTVIRISKLGVTYVHDAKTFGVEVTDIIDSREFNFNYHLDKK